MDPPRPMEQIRCRALSSSSGMKGLIWTSQEGCGGESSAFPQGKSIKDKPSKPPLAFSSR